MSDITFVDKTYYRANIYFIIKLKNVFIFEVDDNVEKAGHNFIAIHVLNAV